MSSYHPQSLGVVPPSGIVPVVGSITCKDWFLAATQGDSANITGLFPSWGKVFSFYLSNIGVSPYFTYGGNLYRFRYTGYDPLTKKYHPGGTNIFEICVDNRGVYGSSAPFTIGSARQGVPKSIHLGHMKRGTGDLAFNPALVAGLYAQQSKPSGFNPALAKGLVSNPMPPGVFPPAGLVPPVVSPAPSASAAPVTVTPPAPALPPAAPAPAPTSSSIPPTVMALGVLLAAGIVGGFIVVLTDARS